MFTAIVPTCRPDKIETIASNWLRQKFSNKRLIIVENGPAIGSCHRVNLQSIIPDLIVRSSEPHVSLARNVGIETALDLPDTQWLAMCDDDDWYGANYLTEMAKAIEIAGPGCVYGKAISFAYLGSHGFCLFAEPLQYTIAGFLHGPTIVIHKDVLADLRYDKVGSGEDMKLCEELRNRRIPMLRTSIYNYAYLRGNDENLHTWKTSNSIISALLTQCGVWYQLGNKFNPEIVDGKVDWKPIALKRGKSGLLHNSLVKLPIIQTNNKPIELLSSQVIVDVGL